MTAASRVRARRVISAAPRAVVAAVLALLVLVASPGPAGAVQPAGTVERLVGIANAIAAATGFTRALKEGSTVLVGDRIETQGQARLRLRMNDGATITLGDNSSLVVEAYDTAPSNGQALLNVPSGIFLAITGGLATLGPDRFKVQTPLAVLAVRGTEVWGNVAPTLLDVTMLSGTAVDVITSGGVATLATPESGVTLTEGQPVPPVKQWGAAKLAYARAAVAFPE